MLLQLCSLLHVLLPRMVGICWLSRGLWAGLQETYPVRHSHSVYPRQTSCGSRWWHWHHPVPPAQHIFWRSRRPPAGCWRWMQDVVRQLVGFGMFAGHVMNLKGSQRAPTQGEMFHVTSMHSHVWAMLSSALHVLYRFRSFLPAVHCGYKLCAEYAGPYRPCRWPAGVKDDTWRRFWRGVGQKGGTHTIKLSQYFCCNTWPLYVQMLSAC
jgi:hypothetical protein